MNDLVTIVYKSHNLNSVEFQCFGNLSIKRLGHSEFGERTKNIEEN